MDDIAPSLIVWFMKEEDYDSAVESKRWRFDSYRMRTPILLVGPSQWNPQTVRNNHVSLVLHLRWIWAFNPMSRVICPPIFGVLTFLSVSGQRTILSVCFPDIELRKLAHPHGSCTCLAGHFVDKRAFVHPTSRKS